MRNAMILAALLATAGASPALAQSSDIRSDTRSDTRSNNGVVRQRVVQTYCENGYCERSVERRAYREGRRGWRDRREARWRDRDDDRRWRGRDRDDDDD